MKRKTAGEILAESFRELAGSKPVDEITVPNAGPLEKEKLNRA